MVGLVGLLVAGTMACGGAVAGGRTDEAHAGGAGGFTSGGAPSAAGGAVTSQVTSLVLTPAQREGIEGETCGRLMADSVNVPLALTFLVDTSASMLEAAAASSGTLRWTLARDAASLAIDGLRTGDVAGLVLFPNQPETGAASQSCVDPTAVRAPTEVGVSPRDPRVVLRSAIHGVSPSGGTPLFDAYRLATDTLTSTSKRAYVVLISDGRATMSEGCQGSGDESTLVDTQNVIDAIAVNQSRGIGTIVAGTTRNEPAVDPSNEVRDWLSNAATAGGTSIPSSCNPSGNPKYCHVDLTQGVSGLAELLQAVGQRPSCTVLFDATVPAFSAIEHVYLVFDSPIGNSVLYGRTDASCPDSQGFYLDAARNAVVLCDASCSHVQRDPFGSLSLIGTCLYDQWVD